VLAVYPLALWWGRIAVAIAWPAAARRRLASLALGHLVLLGLLGSVLAIDQSLVGRHRLYPSQQIMIHDLTAVSIATGTVSLPESLVVERDGPVSVAKLACVYTPDSAVTVFNGRHEQCAFRLRKVTDGRRMAALRDAWLRVVPRHLAAYGAHRLAVLREMLGIGRARVCYPSQTGTGPNSLGLEFRGSPAYVRALRLATAAAYETPLFRGWLYLAAVPGLVVLALARDPRTALPAVVLGASALLYELGYLAVATACDFRMNWWAVLVALVLPVVAIAPPPAPRAGGSDDER
jgi:hypothetical protein